MAFRFVAALVLAAPALAQNIIPANGLCGGFGFIYGTCATGSTCVRSSIWTSYCEPTRQTATSQASIISRTIIGLPTTTTTSSARSTTKTTTTTSSITTPSITTPSTTTPSATTISVATTSTTTTTTQPTVTSVSTTAIPTTTTTPSPTTPSSTSTSEISTGSCSSLTTNPTSTPIAELPDPFTNVAGSKVVTKDDWACRREELSQLLQIDELGVKPPAPSGLNGTLSGNTLTIYASEGGQSISFTVTISYPSSGTAPYPAIIAYGGSSIPIPAGVATITFNNDDIAAQNDSTSRGQGKFYTLYGANHSAGAMIAWAWGVSRIIDVLETISNSRIDLQHIGVTGCSRNGKGALVAGAFDDRIALTIPQESGSGGSACWRLSDAQLASGQSVQTASEIVQENVWLSTNFNAFSTSVPNLPVDHHSLAGLVAPRGLLLIDNSGITWLGNMSSYGCMKAGHTIYEALGVPDAMGFSQVAHQDHCAFQTSQQSDLTAFINKFLFGQSTNTTIFRTDQTYTNFNASYWMPWAVPSLS